MTTPPQERLYNLLPSIYRIRDAEHGEALRALMAVIETELDSVEDDISGLYRDWFIETCEEWVIPYIGQMMGVRPLHQIESAAGYSLRAYVANTLAYRRRKGTPAVLEQLARDVTGWRSRVVEFFKLLATTQHMNHIRLDNQVTLDLRNRNHLDLLEGPFQWAAHTADVRLINEDNGWYNIPNVGLFLWRLQPYYMSDCPPTRAGDGLYHFSSLGHDMPLFNLPESEDDITHIAEEINVPAPIRMLAFRRDLTSYRSEHLASPEEDRPDDSSYYGPNRGVGVHVDGNRLGPAVIIGKDLSAWDRPPAGFVAIDVVSGRLAFALGEDPGTDQIRVSYAYGFSADLGGGPYDRFDTLAGPEEYPTIEVAKGTAIDTIQAALAQWTGDGKPDAIIQFQDNGVYGGDVDVELPSYGSLVIEAADGKRPTVRQVGNMTFSGSEGSSITLNGLSVEGAVELSGDLELCIKHTTLVPGMRLNEDGTPRFPDRDSIVTTGAATDNPQVNISNSVVGSIRLPAEARGLAIMDSVVDACTVGLNRPPAIAANDDATLPGPPTYLDRVTVFGRVYVRQLDMASEVIFNDPAVAVRKQAGCARFSYFPDGSQTPRRYRCQPDLALEAYAEGLGKDGVSELTGDEVGLVFARLRPRFSSEHYGDPGYAQLGRACAVEVYAGAEDGSEMGVFEQLKQPQREANLRTALQEYLPFGLSAGLIRVT